MYMVTTCTAGRRSTLGTIRLGEMRLSRLGAIVAAHWLDLPAHHGPLVQVDAFVVMPNHLHGIITILPANRCPDAPAVVPLGNLVGGFKSSVTREWNQLCGTPGGAVWQPRFYEHIIRHEKALARIRDYIRNNPQQWTIDRENPKAAGENEFYRWLEAYCRKSSPGGLAI
jgi:REP element-mobilizing transposase RayT